MDSHGKCPNCQQLNHIKSLSRQVLKKYDELLEKYKENERQYNEVVETLREREAMLENMKGLIEPAVSEHERLKVKFDIEVNCRNEAENVARKVTAQNKTLKRQSQALLSHLEKIDITQVPEEILEVPEEEEDEADYTETLNATIKDLEEKVSYYVTELESTREQLALERQNITHLQQTNENLQQNVEQVENTLTQYQGAMKQLATMSESAYQEYKLLQTKYEIESKQKEEIERAMQQIKSQNDAMKTQSTILLSSVGDQKLTFALCKVEELEEEKGMLEAHVDTLQKQISSLESEDRVELLESENNKLSKEIEELTKSLTNYEQLYTNLQNKYKELERKLESALRPTLPPPPPPPPPPPISQPKGFLARIRGKKKQKGTSQGAAVVEQPEYNKALQEMMKRINSGKPILQGAKQTKERPKEESQEPGAMQELHSVLNRFKTTKRKSVTRQLSNTDSESNELQNVLSRFKSSTKKVDKPSSTQQEEQEQGGELSNALNRLKKSPSKRTDVQKDEATEQDSELTKVFSRLKREVNLDDECQSES